MNKKTIIKSTKKAQQRILKRSEALKSNLKRRKTNETSIKVG